MIRRNNQSWAGLCWAKTPRQGAGGAAGSSAHGIGTGDVGNAVHTLQLHTHTSVPGIFVEEISAAPLLPCSPPPSTPTTTTSSRYYLVPPSLPPPALCPPLSRSPPAAPASELGGAPASPVPLSFPPYCYYYYDYLIRALLELSSRPLSPVPEPLLCPRPSPPVLRLPLYRLCSLYGLVSPREVHPRHQPGGGPRVPLQGAPEARQSAAVRRQLHVHQHRDLWVRNIRITLEFLITMLIRTGLVYSVPHRTDMSRMHGPLGAAPHICNTRSTLLYTPFSTSAAPKTRSLPTSLRVSGQKGRKKSMVQQATFPSASLIHLLV